MSGTAELKFTPTHEWVKVAGKLATVGITDHAQKEISDVVFIELPKQGRILKQKESAMVVESVKAAFDIYAPLSGKVVRVNEKLKDNPAVVNQSPYEEGWLFQIEIAEAEEMASLLDENQYLQLEKQTH